RNIVEAFLRQQLSLTTAKTYLEIFDDYLKFLQGKADPNKIQKRVSVNSVKVLRICVDINSELDKKQKYIVLIRLIEFAYSSHEKITELESEVLSLVADTFRITGEEFATCISFASCKNTSHIKDAPELLLINNNNSQKLHHAKHIINDTLQGDLWILNVKSAGMLFVKYFGGNQLTLNGQLLLNDTVYVFSPGSVIRGTQARPVYYSDVARMFLEDVLHSEIGLNVKNVEFIFRSGKKGLHPVSFKATSGNLIGIMGGSGAGKSTLLNILNSTLHPVNGTVTINGLNIHTEKEKLEGVIGYIPQDDLLMEELTVFQNLFFNSKLCFGNLDDDAIKKKVNNLAESMGLAEIKDLKVGDSLNKMISGGQRKRLNIALELIRTPSVLFVDEPTSGLSSLDSENVMDLLKQLSISGKLIFTVIHQPSSDVFKMFDKLLILDMGGYPVYFGNPSDAIIYFKTKANYADADEGECETCGNINPEQIFSIIESKVLDEFGNPTSERKISPPEWNFFYKNNTSDKTDREPVKKENPLPSNGDKKPSRFKQLSVFIQRDLLSKLRNTQYLLINLLEAPVLAFILSYFLKYYKEGSPYVFRENVNLVAYIFMSVIVALFMGLSVSAEEIIGDRKILKRETFLNLSRSSYLLSKIAIMFSISAIQTFTFVLIGNSITGIHDMYLDYWLMLFSISCFANLLGLNISSSFKSVVTIYILIPFLIIPQIILSGVIVKFDKLNPAVTFHAQDRVPLVGEIMASRWAFEALALNQFKNNQYEKIFFDADKQKSNVNYKIAWIGRMNDKLIAIQTKKYSGNSLNDQILTLKNEVEKESKVNPEIKFNNPSEINPSSWNQILYQKLKIHFEALQKYYNRQYKNATIQRDLILKTATKSLGGNEALNRLEANYTNKNLTDFVLDVDNVENSIEYKHEIVQRYAPAFMDGPHNSFIRSQFFVSRKNVFGNYCSTYSVNLVVIWLMTIALSLTLYFNVLKFILRRIEDLFE
ncbi:MAG: ATP-binding cassette domain-containing protein, partial [Bacteroidota bacterium]